MNKPLPIESTLKVLNPIFKKWFFSQFKELSLPQQYSIYTINARENILVSAPTGSGKTLSAFGAVLNELTDLESKGKLEDKIYCVYISPLKALNNDIRRNLELPLSQIEEQEKRKIDLRVGVRTGDTTQYEKAKMAKTPPHILITTPESLAIMLSSPKFKENFTQVQWLIIDEVHSIAENKRGTHLSLSMERLQLLSPGLTRVGLSATVAPLEEVAKFLVGSKRPCKIVDVQFIKEYDFQVISPVDDLMNVSQKDLHEKLYKLLDKLLQEHRTTLIFTNTRAATERVVHHLRDTFPKNYTEIQDENNEARTSIGAHHGSLSKEHRLNLELSLKEGKLKAVVCSTSLELGIDIGYVDLVVCLGSPKSVARLLQRAGRAGHALHKITKARIIVLDRDDLIECSVMLKAALDKKIDRIHIPKNALDVLAQHIVGMATEQTWSEEELFKILKRSYCYESLSRKDFNDVLDYLSGKFAGLEDQNVYAKIWREAGNLGKKGRLTRVIYMTNLGTIPDETSIKVKLGDVFIGTIDEGFLERLKPGDIFVLGGSIYEFRHAKGMVVQVRACASRPPTVPSWFSEQLPLSFDLAMQIGNFRGIMEEKLEAKMSKTDLLDFIHAYLHVDEKAAKAIYQYMKEQYDFAKVLPTNKRILIEHYHSDTEKKIVFHTLYGRRVNDCLSRAIAFSISLTQKRDVEVGINDNGFYISFAKPVNARLALEQLSTKNLPRVMDHAIDKSEALKRRFRHCAMRSFMILRNYKGREKRVGKQQMSSMILLKALRDLDPNFSVIREAKREVLEDVMDLENCLEIIERINDGKITISEIHTKIPSPFAFNLVLQGHLDVLKMEDKLEFLKRMHGLVLAKISLGGKPKDLLDESEKIVQERGSVEKQMLEHFKKYESEEDALHPVQKRLLLKARRLRQIPLSTRQELIELIKGKPIAEAESEFIQRVSENKKEIIKEWPKELSDFLFTSINRRESFDMLTYCEEIENNPQTKTELQKEKMIESIKLLTRRKALPDELKWELIDLVNGKEVSPTTKAWIKEFVKSTIPKYVVDELFFLLKESLK